MNIQRRAVTEEQRLTRRQDLLDIAWELFRENTFETINMVDIAKKAGLAKGTLYLYFKTKEELFLAVETQQLQVWFDEVDAKLNNLAACNQPALVAQAVCQSLTEHPGVARLMAILYGTLECNVDYATALSFKRLLLARIQAVGTRVEVCLPSLAAGQGVQLTMWAYACIIGLQQVANPSPVIQEVLAREAEMAPLKMDFESQCCQILQALFSGAVAM